MKTFYGIDLESYDVNTDYVSKSINDYGCWEPIVTNTMLKILENEKGICIDVGTFIGYYTFLFGKYNKTFAFEADSITYSKLEATKNKYDFDIKIRNNAISNSDENILYVNHSKNESNVGGSCVTGVETDIKVLTLKLDTFMEKNSIDMVLILKIDVEGHELEALQGMINNIKNKTIKYIFLEITPKFVGIEETVNTVKILTENGYKCWDLGLKEVGRLEDYKDYDYKKYQIFDIENFIIDNQIIQRDVLFTL